MNAARQAIDRVEVRHADPMVARQVREWFAGGIPASQLNGDRSVHIPHPGKEGFDLKIKGAGFRGGPIRFGTMHNTGPKAPVFDFDGRMMEDVAAGHDNAFRGGASFQQAATEYRVSGLIAGLGYPVVPCLGYGKVEYDGHVSWFSVFEWDRSWNGRFAMPHIPVETWMEANRSCGQLIFDLAVEHDLIGYCWYSARPDGSYLIKDLHPFRHADPVNMSQISWVMQVFFSLHILCLAAVNLPRWSAPEDIPEDLQAYPLRSFCPGAGRKEHDALRFALVPRYMLGPPADFCVRDLLTVLRGNPISRALLDACPDKFARF